MKIFGFNITKEKPQLQLFKDEIPEIKATLPPDTLKPALVKPVKDPTLYYRQMRLDGRGAFTPSEYDLVEIGRIEDTDSYVRQAFDKKVALMFKEGWDLVGKNPQTVKYVEARLGQIARASGLATQSLFRAIGSGLIRRSNAFLVKVRKLESSGGKVRQVPGSGKKLQPVAGYFVLPAENMEYQYEGNKITMWRQKLPDGKYIEFSPDNIVHIYFDRKEGFVFGTPTLVPVVDDIRALRKIEENIELLVYQHLFPLFQYKVGTKEVPCGMTEDGQREIEVVKREIQFMPSEGGIVTPERHEIIAIGAEGRALRAEGYLEHFKKRVFSGLGVSAVDMGEGETANRATADNMSRNMVDSVKDLQQVMETMVNDLIINELLLESTFGDTILDAENLVSLRFKEIDLDAQIKVANHYADLFTKNVITFDEVRRLGPQLEAIMMPTQEEFESGEDMAQKYPEWHRTHWKLFEEPKLLIQAIDEPYSPAAKAAAKANAVAINQGDLDEAQEAGDEDKKKEAETQVQIAKAKAKAKPKPAAKKVKNGYLQTTYNSLIQDVIIQVDQSNKMDFDWVGQVIRAGMEPTINRLIADQVLEFRKGYVDVANPGDIRMVQELNRARTYFRERANRYINRLTNNVITTLQRKVDVNTPKTEMLTQVRAVLESFKYRTDFIEDVELRKANQWGHLQAWKLTNVDTRLVDIAGRDDQCDMCKEHNASGVELTFLTLEDMPPFHANCHCYLTVSNVAKKDSVETKQLVFDFTPGVLPCTKCGRTAWYKGSNEYHCNFCKEKFHHLKESNVTEEPDCGKKVETGKESNFTKCKVKAAAQLRQRHPGFTEDQILQLAEAACMHHLVSEAESSEVADGEKVDSCVKQVKADLRKKHPDWSDKDITSSAWAICNASLKGK